MRGRAAGAAALLALALGAGAAAAQHREIDTDAATEAIVRIRRALPPDWRVSEIAWDTVPAGWQGDSTCVLVRAEDGSMRFPHRDGFTYRAFYKLWLLPLSWEGRMRVSGLGAGSPCALYLGENERLRVLYRTLGRNTWPEGRDSLAAALELDAYPLEDLPQHSLDVGAMQILYRRLDARPGHLERWQRQIYGIEELPRIVYLELLTWDQRRDSADPTFLGELAERESAYLSREMLAAFPDKRALYLRRLTREVFSDVIVVNRARLVRSP